MRIIERHIAKEFLHCFIFAIIAFLFLFFIIDSFTRLDDFLKNHVPFLLIIKYYLLMLPGIFVQTAPLGCLLSTIYTLGKLNYNNELIALRTGGLSIYKIASPIITTGILISLLCLYTSEKIAGTQQSFADEIKIKTIEKKEKNTEKIFKNMAIYGSRNRQLFINSFDTKNNFIEGLTVLTHDSRQNVVSKMYINRASWDGKHWIADECFFYEFDQHSHLRDSQLLENYQLPLKDPPMDLIRQSKKTIQMSSKDLLHYINKISFSGADTAIRNLWIDFYQKLFLPFNCLVMIFVGLPCAIVISRKAVGFTSIGISVLIALVYYVLAAVSVAMGKNNVFPPLASVLVTPFIFICGSLYFTSTTP